MPRLHAFTRYVLPAVSSCDNVTGPQEQGYIRPSANPYGALVLFVSEKDGGWRSGVDYRVVKSYFIFVSEHIRRLGIVHCPNNLPYQLEWIPVLSEGGSGKLLYFYSMLYMPFHHVC